MIQDLEIVLTKVRLCLYGATILVNYPQFSLHRIVVSQLDTILYPGGFTVKQSRKIKLEIAFLTFFELFLVMLELVMKYSLTVNDSLNLSGAHFLFHFDQEFWTICQNLYFFINSMSEKTGTVTIKYRILNCGKNLMFGFFVSNSLKFSINHSLQKAIWTQNWNLY